MCGVVMVEAAPSLVASGPIHTAASEFGSGGGRPESASRPSPEAEARPLIASVLRQPVEGDGGHLKIAR
jgi:hypothetical protein